MKTNKAKLKNLLTPGDLDAIGNLMGGLLDKQASVLASKKDLQEVKLELKNDMVDLQARMNEGFEAVIDGMDAIVEKLADKEKFDRLVVWAREVGEKVGVRPKI
jgi:hypothetical protein